jgi:8-oxo-dGTP diphosphatase
MTVQAMLYEEGHALAVADSLRHNGYPATVRRERLAGEDDDEDHPWVVVCDAPVFMVELLVEEYDGWVDVVAETPPAQPRSAPLDLPDAPRRVKGHFRDGDDGGHGLG